MLIALVPLLFAIAGLVLWLAVSPSPKPWADIGRLVFFAAFLVLMMVLSHETWKIG